MLIMCDHTLLEGYMMCDCDFTKTYWSKLTNKTTLKGLINFTPYTSLK